MLGRVHPKPHRLLRGSGARDVFTDVVAPAGAVARREVDGQIVRLLDAGEFVETVRIHVIVEVSRDHVLGVRLRDGRERLVPTERGEALPRPLLIHQRQHRIGAGRRWHGCGRCR